MQVQPYLNFDGRCEEAVEFYRRAIGAEVQMMMRFKEAPEPPAAGMVPPGSGDKIMHAAVKAGDTMFMASDGCNQGKAEFRGFSMSLTASNGDEAERLFAALSEGGKVQTPMMKTFFASKFGMVTDRFGLSWMVIAMP